MDSISRFQRVKSNLLYADMIEEDGRIGKQFTFLGAALLIIGSAAVIGIGYYALVFLGSIFYR